ncbi:MAG: diaminopimelate decarboxylase [Peptostreptococcaceae bacterium]|nr:diaminopimelate decarboxylase [Peptostreptococcaceae bacterium]
MKLFGTMKMNAKNHLEIGGCDAVELAKTHGTPLYVIDENLVRDNMNLFREHFVSEKLDCRVIYASKAFLNMAMCRIAMEEGIGIDAVSAGELHTIIRSDFPRENIYLHGNNKTDMEIEMAVSEGIGRIVVDNMDEVEALERIAMSKGVKADALVRLNPGVTAHTHQYIQTSKHDSKFGESIYGRKIFEIIERILDSPAINLHGFHCHIGSQINDEDPFFEAVSVMTDFIKVVEERTGYKAEELNLGGGFGVYYSGEDSPIKLSDFLSKLVKHIESKIERNDLAVKKVMIEPGRAIVGNAGITLYSVGGVKETYGGRNYIFVDGGMADNPRTALYDARYEAALANRMRDPQSERYTIAGKCCESGDVIIRDIEFPTVKKGDLIVVFTTGAYNYSMSSNYNRLGRPAVVFVSKGKSRVTVKRETLDDLIRNDII